MLPGGSVQKLRYSIDQNAWFVKAGAIIPLAHEGIQELQTPTNEWRIYIAPGKGRSSYVHYEDDGESQAYPSAYATTTIRKNASGSTLTVEIEPRQGAYAGMMPTRKLSLILGGAARCPKATLNGVALECTYDEASHEARVMLPESLASEAQKVQVRW